MLAVIEAPIVFLFQSLVKKMFVIIAEAVPHGSSSRKIVCSIPVINMKKNIFTDNGQISWRNFHFILLSFD